jgi:hypothetical protein
MTPEEQLRRAQRAELLAQDDLFKDAIAKLHADALEKFKAAKTNDDFLRARVQYDLTENFLNVFIGIVRDGQVAKMKIEAAKQAKEKPTLKKADRFTPRHAFP